MVLINGGGFPPILSQFDNQVIPGGRVDQPTLEHGWPAKPVPNIVDYQL